MIIDKIKDISEVRELFESRPMNTDVFSFDFIVNNPHLYCFYGEDDKKLKGIIFITEIENKLFLSGISVPKNLRNCIDALNTICGSYKQDMYSDTDLKHAVFVLKKAGFKKYKNNIYKRRYKNG